MIWKLRYFSFQKQTELAGGGPTALAAAEPHMAAAPETAALCILGMTWGEGTQRASPPPAPRHRAVAATHGLALADNAAASFLLVYKKLFFFFQFV